MEVQLKVVVGGSSGQVVKVPGPKFFIGRAEDCHLRPGSDLISRHHCALMIDGQSIVVRDFASKNGTYVNDERIVGERELKEGDHLRVGPLEFEVVLQMTAPKRPKVTSVQEAATRTAETGSSDNFDLIGDWLTPGAQDAGDTRELQRHDTTTFDMAETSVTPVPKPAEPAVSEPQQTMVPQAPAKGSEKKSPGKLPSVPKSSSDDSHSAAAEMLKKLRRRT
jgi:predicted component of type VI protein secretion system